MIFIQNRRKTPSFSYGDINQYRGTHGNSRLGKSCKTPILWRRCSDCRTKNPPPLGVGSVKELIPSGYDEKHYFVYGQCSEICVTIKGAPVSKLGIFLYDEYKKEYCSLDFSAYRNTVTCIKRINHITEFKKEFGLNTSETYQELENCLLQYIPECTYKPFKETFKKYCERFIMPESL